MYNDTEYATFSRPKRTGHQISMPFMPLGDCKRLRAEGRRSWGFQQKFRFFRVYRYLLRVLSYQVCRCTGEMGYL